MNASEIAAAAAILRVATTDAIAVEPLTETYGSLDVSTAYEIQRLNIVRDLDAGRSVVGAKVGLTSRAMQSMLGVDQPDFGHLLDDMQVPNGGSVDITKLVAPRIEAEIAFRLAEPLKGPDVDAVDVLAATEAVMVALEIVDSRVADWRITIGDTIADNASSARFVLGDVERSPRDVDLRLGGVILEQNGEVVATGAAAAPLGSPVESVAWLARTADTVGLELSAGMVVLSGAMHAMVPVSSGDTIAAEFAGLGRVSVHFEGGA